MDWLRTSASEPLDPGPAAQDPAPPNLALGDQPRGSPIRPLYPGPIRLRPRRNPPRPGHSRNPCPAPSRPRPRDWSLFDFRIAATPPETLTWPRSFQGPRSRPQPAGPGAQQPLSSRPAAACDEDATAVPASGPPRPSSPTGHASALVTPGPRPRAPGPRRRPTPGSRVSRRAPGRPQVPACTPCHVAPVPPPGPPGGQGGPSEDAPGDYPAAVPCGGAGGRRKHRAPRPGPR